MAAIDGKRIIRNAPYRISFVMRDSQGVVDTAPIAVIQTEIAKDFGGLTPTSGEGNQANTFYYVDLTADEMTADTIEFLASASNRQGYYEVLKPEPALDSGEATGSGASSLNLPTATASAVADIYNGAQIEIVRGAGAGHVRTITDYAPYTVTVDRPWEVTATPGNLSVYIIHPRASVPLSTAMRVASNMLEINSDATAAQNLEKMYEGAFITSQIASDPTTTTFTAAAGLTATDDFYNDMFCAFTSGAMAGLTRKVTDYTSALGFTVEAFPSPGPGIGDTFILIAVVP
jgi:hypothetical protein